MLARRSDQASAAASILRLVPSIHMRCNTTTIRRANTTMARFISRRLEIREAQARSGVAASLVQHDRHRLIQGTPEVHIAGLGDTARNIALAGLAARGCQANPRADVL